MAVLMVGPMAPRKVEPMDEQLAACLGCSMAARTVVMRVAALGSSRVGASVELLAAH